MTKVSHSLRPKYGIAATHPAPHHHLRLWTASGGVVALAATLLATGTSAQAATSATSTADAYTVSTMPNENRGDSTKIAVGVDVQDHKTGYLRFSQLADAPATGLQLELSITGGDAGDLRVHQVGSDWTEQSITATNEPTLGSLVGSLEVAGGAQTISIPLTGVQPADDGTVSFALTRDGDGISRIASRESSAELTPKVVHTADAGSPAPAPSPAPGPAPAPTPAPAPVPAPVPEPAPNPGAEECSVSAILVPSCGSWFGASANPLAGESWDTALVNFEKTAGRTMDIAHYYKRGQSALFPNEVELNRQDEVGKNRILFYNWKPTDLTWRQVADGAADGYLRDLAAHMKQNADKPFYLSLNAEMEDEVDLASGSGQTPADFRNFFRHVVQELRGNGVDNAVTVMNYTGIEKWGEMPWFEDLYPGNDVVDWIAQDPYAFGKPPVWLTDFEGMVNRTDGGWPGFYNWAATNYPDKPQMLAEWGVDEDPAYPNYKRDFFDTAADQLAQHPKIKAVVYWDSTGIDTSGNPLIVGDTRVDSATASLNAFRNFVASDFLTAPRKSYLD